MSPLFGQKREEGKTVLILDVESGSVGACLARFSPYNRPRVFGEVRKHVRLQNTHNPDALMDSVSQATEEALVGVAQVAARMRSHPALASVGRVNSTTLFFSPPWGTLSISNRELEPHPFTNRIHRLLEGYFGPLEITAEPFGLAAVHTTPMVLPSSEHYLLSIISSEVTELLLLENSGESLHVIGHATLPLGRHYPLRTLRTHSGLSETEARSAFALHSRGAAPEHTHEALHTAKEHMVGEFGSAARELLQYVPARKVVIIAQEPAGEWFARALAEHPTSADLFPEAGEVRAMRALHAKPFFQQHAHKPDLLLLLGALFVNTRSAYPSSKLGFSTSAI